jgi:hypothetical protein
VAESRAAAAALAKEVTKLTARSEAKDAECASLQKQIGTLRAEAAAALAAAVAEAKRAPGASCGCEAFVREALRSVETLIDGLSEYAGGAALRRLQMWRFRIGF